MIEFVEDCRREWRRLGVPDPIANEMAADLTADIEEAEAEGGSAEDVLGNSVFDAQRFAASWAGARGVTSPALPDGPPRRRAFPLALTAIGAFFGLAAIALLIGRRTASAAVSVRRILAGPGPVRLFGPGSASPPFRSVVLGPQFAGHSLPLIFLAALLFFACIVAFGLAVVYWSPWPRRGLQALARVPRRSNWPKGSSR